MGKRVRKNIINPLLGRACECLDTAGRDRPPRFLFLSLFPRARGAERHRSRSATANVCECLSARACVFVCVELYIHGDPAKKGHAAVVFSLSRMWGFRKSSGTRGSLRHSPKKIGPKIRFFLLFWLHTEKNHLVNFTRYHCNSLTDCLHWYFYKNFLEKFVSSLKKSYVPRKNS